MRLKTNVPMTLFAVMTPLIHALITRARVVLSHRPVQRLILDELGHSGAARSGPNMQYMEGHRVCELVAETDWVLIGRPSINRDHWVATGMVR